MDDKGKWRAMARVHEIDDFNSDTHWSVYSIVAAKDQDSCKSNGSRWDFGIATGKHVVRLLCQGTFVVRY